MMARTDSSEHGHEAGDHLLRVLASKTLFTLVDHNNPALDRCRLVELLVDPV